VARFVLVGSVAGAPPGMPYTSYGTGTKIADSAVNAHLGDIIWLLGTECTRLRV
jgi:hypothetical protein